MPADPQAASGRHSMIAGLFVPVCGCRGRLPPALRQSCYVFIRQEAGCRLPLHCSLRCSLSARQHSTHVSNLKTVCLASPACTFFGNPDKHLSRAIRRGYL
jgi:hypothetical protein